MNTKIYLYIAVCAGVSFLIRELPLTLIRRPIRNRFLRSFLFYVPYVTLAVMTFPSILHTTSSPIAGLAALVLGIAAAWLGKCKTVTQMAAVIVMLIEPVSFISQYTHLALSYILIAAMTFMTVWSGISYFKAYLPVLKED